MDKKLYLPFYMSYPIKYPYDQENKVVRDMEYLREMYPKEAQKLLVRIAEILDRLDYEDSMIYDEYPDRWQMYRLAENVVKILKEDAERKEENHSKEEWEWISDMVQVLLFDEIFNRRNGKAKRRSSSIFMDIGDWKIPYGKG